MLKTIYRFYEKKLESEVRRGKIPGHVMVITSFSEIKEGFENLLKFMEWCKHFGVSELTLCLADNPDFGRIERLMREIPYRVCLVSKERIAEFEGSENLKITVNMVKGREEIVHAARELANDIISKKISANDIDEGEIEKRLKIKSEPDLIIRASHSLEDFLIWQSIYSEHLFSNLNWKNLRYIDFLRILREYQKRERRYGR